MVRFFGEKFKFKSSFFEISLKLGQISDDFRWAEMNLLPEHLFKCSLDGIVVTDVCSTKNGRIFLAARDGCLYELDYQVSSGNN